MTKPTNKPDTTAGYKVAGAAALAIGWGAAVGGFAHLLGTAGLFITVGVPLMVWGAWTMLLMVQVDTIKSNIDEAIKELANQPPTNFTEKE